MPKEEFSIKIPTDLDVDMDAEDSKELKRFRKMLEDFEHFASTTRDPFGPLMFLYKTFDIALNRAHNIANNNVKNSQTKDSYICATKHLKRCIDMLDDMSTELESAMGDVRNGDLVNNMPILQIEQIMKKLGL